MVSRRGFRVTVPAASRAGMAACSIRCTWSRRGTICLFEASIPGTAEAKSRSDSRMCCKSRAPRPGWPPNLRTRSTGTRIRHGMHDLHCALFRRRAANPCGRKRSRFYPLTRCEGTERRGRRAAARRQERATCQSGGLVLAPLFGWRRPRSTASAARSTWQLEPLFSCS